MGRIFAAALVGGLIVFGWGAVAHIATPLGMAGMSAMQNEDRVIDKLRESAPRSGMYIFPAEGVLGNKSEAAQKAWQEKFRRGPSGILLYTAGGGEPMDGRKLVTEFISDVLAALVAALIVAMIVGSYCRRVLVVLLLALFAFFSLSVSYWNWYGFPTAYLGAELTMELIGWLLAGLAIAKIAPRSRVPAA
jgi:hypothetical protein